MLGNAELITGRLFKIVRHPETIGAATKYLGFLIIAQQSKMYIAAALVNISLIALGVMVRNRKLSQ